MDRYPVSIDEIPDSMLSDMQKQAEDVIIAYAADYEGNEWAGNYKMNGFPEYVGLYFQSEKVDGNNRIYLIYTLNATNTDTTMDYYFFVEFFDAILYADGTSYIDLNNAEIPFGSLIWSYGDDFFSTGEHGFVGFKRLSDFEQRYLRAEQDAYNWSTDIQ